MYDTLTIRRDARDVQYVTLNRPAKRNALSAQMIADLTHMAQTVPDGTRAVVLAGEGKVFCAGGDLDWMHDQIKADRATRMAEARKLAMMLQALNTIPAPLIGRIHDGAFGGGVGLVCICDVAVAAADCKFGLTETRLGLIPATISPYVLARLGEGNARRVFMSSRIFGADEAVQLGVVAKAVEVDELDAAIEAEITPYLTTYPAAVASAKALARKLGPVIDDAVIDDCITALADTWETQAAADGIAKFLQAKA